MRRPEGPTAVLEEAVPRTANPGALHPPKVLSSTVVPRRLPPPLDRGESDEDCLHGFDRVRSLPAVIGGAVRQGAAVMTIVEQRLEDVRREAVGPSEA